MSTQEESNDMPRKPKSKTSADNVSGGTDVPKGTLVIDYNGTIAAVPGQPAVPHTSSPLIEMWPDNGQEMLVLHPGVNIVDAGLWHFYTKVVDDGRGHPDLRFRQAKGQVEVIDGPPKNERLLLDLIERTIDHDGLAWLMEQEEAEDEPRDHILSAIKARAAKANPVKFKAKPRFQATVPTVGRDRHEYNVPQPGHGM